MDLDWTPRPVLHFDFNSENFSEEEGLRKLLHRLLKEYEKKYGITDIEDSFAGRFSRLIRHAAESTGREVVILIDEYDKPLLDIEENKGLFEKNQRILKSFFGNLKSMDRYIRFAMITGVARFNRVSIFSDLNNLDDISLEDTFADICGWNEEELVEHFTPGIQTLADKRNEDFDTTLKELRDYYDGYLFTEEGTRQYNPFSPFHYYLFQKYLTEGRPNDFMERLATLLKALPYDDNNESTYRAVTFLLTVLSGTPAIAEPHSYRGRSDLEVFAGKNIYVFEFKYDKRVEEALEQILERDYAGKYALDPRAVYIIGANYCSDEEKRGLTYEVLKIKD